MKFIKDKRLLPQLPAPDEHTFFGRLKKLLQNYSYVICAFLVPLILYWAMYILMGCYPFGENSVLVLDLNGQYVYFFEALRNALHGDANLLYSWARSLGGEFIGIYAYYLASPLSYLVFFFSENHITEALLTIILLKCGISGATMSYYLKKNRPAVKELWVILFSTMYALSSYVIAYAHNTMWMDAFMLFPLVIYGVEQIIKKHNCTLFVVTLTLTLMSTFYIGYMVCIFVFFYFFYYYIASSADYGNNFYGEKLHFLKSLIRMGISAAVSLAISALILIPTYYALTFGKTTFSDPSWEMTSQFNLIEFFAKMLPGGYDTVRPDGLPFVYCGLLTLLILPVFFLSKNVKLREKISAVFMLSFLVICMENSVSDLIWHCFQRPNWLNYRYSFMFIFLLIVFACRGAEELAQTPPAQLLWGGAGLVGLIILLQTQNLEFVDTFLCVWLSILLIAGHLAGLAAYISAHWKPVGTVVLSALVCGEMVIAGMLNITSLDADVVISTRTSYVSYMDRVKGIVNSVQESDQSFYRMEKTVFRNVCDNMALNIRGISNSTSTLNASAIRLLNDLGYSSTSHWSKYLGGTPAADALLGLKYIIYDQTDKVPDYYEAYMEDLENSLYAYLNPYALSVAYAASGDIQNLELWNYNVSNYVSPFEAINAIVTALLGSDETIEVFKAIDYSLTMDSNTECTYSGVAIKMLSDANGNPILDENGNEIKVETPYYFYGTNNSESGKMRYRFELPEDVPENSNVYFFFATEYPRSVDWSLRGDSNNLTGTCFSNESDCIQQLGKLSHGIDYGLDITFTSEDQKFYVMQEPGIFYYLDEAVFKDAFTRLAEGNFKIEDDYSESRLTGSIYVPENCSIVFTTIPYDEGWNIYVDGKKVEPIKTLDALLAFEITPGDHTLELRYCSDYMTAGLVISIAGLLIGILLWWIDRRFFRPKLPAMRRAFEKVLAQEEAIRKERDALELAKLSAETDKSSFNPSVAAAETETFLGASKRHEEDMESAENLSEPASNPSHKKKNSGEDK